MVEEDCSSTAVAAAVMPPALRDAPRAPQARQRTAVVVLGGLFRGSGVGRRECRGCAPVVGVGTRQRQLLPAKPRGQRRWFACKSRSYRSNSVQNSPIRAVKAPEGFILSKKGRGRVARVAQERGDGLYRACLQTRLINS